MDTRYILSLFKCQWTTDVSDTEHAWGQTESSPAFAAASCECDSARQIGLITQCLSLIKHQEFEKKYFYSIFCS